MEFDNSTDTISPDDQTVLTIGGTGGLVLPKGTTAQRDATSGALRYNTDTNEVECNFGGTYKAVLKTTNLSSLNISAAGTTQGTATALAESTIVRVTTVTAGQGVQLPASVTGYKMAVVNASAVDLLVYPSTGGFVDTGAQNAGYTLKAGKALLVQVSDALRWEVLSDTGLTGGGGGGGVTSITGTANQIAASASTGAVTLSIPSGAKFPGSPTILGNILTFQDNGIGTSSGFNMSRTNDWAGLYLTEVSLDATKYQFVMGDNGFEPGTAPGQYGGDSFEWNYGQWQGTHANWTPLNIQAGQIRTIAIQLEHYGLARIRNLPFYTGGASSGDAGIPQGLTASPNTVSVLGSALVTDLAVSVASYATNAVHRVVVQMDTTTTYKIWYNPTNFAVPPEAASLTGTFTLGTPIPLGGVLAGVTVTFNTGITATAGKMWGFTVFPGGLAQVDGDISVGGAYKKGTLSFTPTNALAALQTSVNSYNQVIVQNTSAGTAASSQVVVNNDISTDTTNFGAVGINSSGFTYTAGVTTLFSQPSAITLEANGGDLVIGTSSNNAVKFVVNNSAVPAMAINANGSVSIGGATGTAGQVLTSTGATTAPTWSTPAQSGGGSTLGMVYAVAAGYAML